MNFNMNSMERSLTDLLAMLRIVEKDMKSKTKAPQQVLLIGKTNKRKASGNNSSKAKQAKKGDQPKKKKGQQKPNSDEKDAVCFHCGKKGHWKRNCFLFKKKISSEGNSSGIFMIECNLSISSAWVIDTGCGSHICVDLQGLNESRKLSKGEMDLRVANGARLAALAVGTYSISLPSGLVLMLENC